MLASPDLRWSRRDLLQASATWGLLSASSAGRIAAATRAARPRVAAILTTCFHRSHAHVILENFLEPYLFNGELVDPGMDVVSIYLDQTKPGDLGQRIAQAYQIPIYPSIASALCQGGVQLAVDGVLSIGEHGDYPSNAKGQVEYPRPRFFGEIAAEFVRSGRSVPVFNDKHLACSWTDAKAMYDRAVELKIPFLAGSSVPLAERRPPLTLPAGAPLVEAVSIHGGPVESYDIHGLEVLQSLVEDRAGGETGVSQVQFLTGLALWEAAAQGRWDPRLAVAALSAETAAHPVTTTAAAREFIEAESARVGSAGQEHALLITYRDGLRGCVLKVGLSGTQWYFAARLRDEAAPRATSFYVGPWDNRNLFKALSHSMQVLIRDKIAPYPVERTLLTTGILDAAMDSRQRGQAVTTEHLDITYAARDFSAMRETGASWKILTEGTPQPEWVHNSRHPPG